MPDFHRLVTPTYVGGLPASFDYINNPALNVPADPGAPAPTDISGKKAAGVNQGTYLVAFTEPATASNTNRGMTALAANCDFLDDSISGGLAIPAEVIGVAGPPIVSLQIVDTVFVGMAGVYLPTQVWRDKLISVLDSVTGDELVTAAGVKVTCSQVFDSTDTFNEIGVPASGFYVDPYIHFNPPIPPGATYKIVYGKASSLNKVVRAKLNQDALTAIAIRSSEEVPAAATNFFMQTSRRIGASVIALASAIFETPGSGGNIGLESASMALDIDPEDTFADRSLIVRAARESGPINLISFTESFAGNSLTLQTFKSVMLLCDNTMSTNNGPMALTSATHYGFFRMEADCATSPPLYEMINSRWTVTIGDGTSSWGDYNGAGALAAALVDFAAHPIIDVAGAGGRGKGMTILVKPGTYTLSDLIVTSTVANGSHVEIVGLDKQNCVLNASAAAAFGISAHTYGTLVLRNLTISTTAVAKVGVKSGNMGSAQLYNCRLIGVSVSADRTGADTMVVANYNVPSPAILCKACSFVPSAGLNNVAISVIISGIGGDGDIGDILIEDCYLETALDFPICSISGTSCTVRKVCFSHCQIQLHGASTVGGPTYGGNSGVVQLLPTSTTGIIRELSFIECQVRGGVDADTGLLLYLRNRVGGNYFNIDTVKISGGRWSIPSRVVNQLTPFYIGGGTYGAVSNIKNVIVKDVSWGFEGTSDYGAQGAPVELGASATQWAAFFMTADELLSVSNLTYISSTVRSRYGDLYLRTKGGAMQVDGVFLLNWATPDTNYGSPKFRVFVEDVGVAAGDETAASKVSRVIVNGGTHGHGVAGTANDGLIAFAGNAEDDSYTLILDRCEARGFTAGATINGFVLRGNGHSFGGVEMVGCQAVDVTGHGLAWNSIVADYIKSLSIHNCLFDNCGSWGAFIQVNTDIASTFTNLRVYDNVFTNNTDGGLCVAPGFWTGAFEISHNYCRSNGGGAPPGLIDIFIGWTSSSHPNAAKGILMGNDCGGAGEIWFHESWQPMRGAASKYTVAAAPGTFSFSDALGLDGEAMLFNNAIIRVEP